MVDGVVGGTVGGIVLAAKSHPQDRTPARGTRAHAIAYNLWPFTHTNMLGSGS